jgi:hypothetical protein
VRPHNQLRNLHLSLHNQLQHSLSQLNKLSPHPLLQLLRAQLLHKLL